MKSVGIITMHKVWNAGSALQAFALQHVIEDIGYNAQLIDYKYPNLEHAAYQSNIADAKSLGIGSLLKLLLSRIKSKLRYRRVTDNYSVFYKRHFHCTEKMYTTRRSLLEDGPKFDIYITGSDQVWNPEYIGFDTNYMLEFAPKDAKKISYASSFSIGSISGCFNKVYADSLSQYDVISVREQSGVEIVKNLTGKNATVCCDPTLLLDKNDWGKLAEESVISVKQDYILVYIMGYAYDPYPDIYKHIDRVANNLKLPVIFYNSRKGKYKAPYGEIKINHPGPCEFLWLFQHAKFIVTDSFHGTAFSLNFERPFMSVVKSFENTDSRVMNILKVTGAMDRAVICSGEQEQYHIDELSESFSISLNHLRMSSLDFLRSSLIKI